MSSNPRFSNAISNIDMNSYRAYKNLLNSGKQSSPDKSRKGSNFNGNAGLPRSINNHDSIQAKNLTKYIFSSQSKRFEWQTSEAINRHSELTGSLASKRHQHLNSGNWEGFNNISQDEQAIKNHKTNRNSQKLGSRNLESRITDDFCVNTIDAKEPQERNRKASCPGKAKQLTKSSSMSDIFNKTPENVVPVKKYSHLLYPKTDIFNRQTVVESRGGKRNISMENIRSDADYSGKRYQEMNEVHFINLYKDKNYLNPSINMRVEGKNSVTHMKMDKPKLNKYASKASTDFHSISSKNKNY